MLRKLAAADAAAFWTLRRRALAEEPRAFGESVEEFEQSTIESYESRLSANTAENFVIGAFDDSQVVGTTGLYRESRRKRRHTAGVWGVYVAPEYRGRGLARQLMASLIEHAKLIPVLESLHWTVATSQTAAHKVVESLGFKSYGIEKNALLTSAGYVDEDHMVLNLNSTE